MEETLERDILMLRQVSPNLESYVCSQEYVSKYGQDNVKVSDILLDLYEMTLQELKEIGIVFWDTENSIFEDWYQARSIYYFRKVFDDKYLYGLFEQNDSMLSMIEALITGDESDDGDAYLVLEVLSNTFNNDPDIAMCMEFKDRVISTRNFEMHILAIISEYRNRAIMTIDDDPTKIIDYIKQINLGITWVKTGIDKIYANLDKVDIKIDKIALAINKDIVNTLIEHYDEDKVQPLEIKYYSELDLPDDKVDKALLSLKSKYMNIHHERSPHHIEYWKKHGTIQLTPAHMVVLVAHHYSTYDTSEEFVKKFATMRQIAVTIFTKDQLKILDIFGLALLMGMRDTGEVNKYGDLPDSSIIS